jgi:transketolase
MSEVNKNYEKIAKEIRKKILKMIFNSQTSHIGSALSVVDILTVLYFKILSIDPKAPWAKNRDRFILSKGHAVSAWYATLAKRGFFNEEILDKYCVDGGILSGHPDRFSVPGIESSTGSLGHGLPIGVGLAFAGKKDKKNYRVFVLMSDGECEEGSVWEAAISASRLKLDNLIGIIDANKLQAYEKTDNIQPISSLKGKFENFGWSVKETDGHNFEKLEQVFRNIPIKKGKPTMIIAHTIKGKGIPTMENKLEWHYRSPKENQLKDFFEMLEM